MQRRSIEDYIREMEQMRERAVFAPASVKAAAEPRCEEALPVTETDGKAVQNQADTEISDQTVYLTDDDRVQTKTEDNGIGMGRLTVTVTSGGGLFPVENATVIVSRADGLGGDEIAAVKTDQSGKTPVFYLPAPDKDMSQQPQAQGKTEETRSQYDITVSAPGYVTAVVEGVSVFDGVTAIQKIDMLTISASDGNTEPRVLNEQTVYQL